MPSKVKAQRVDPRPAITTAVISSLEDITAKALSIVYRHGDLIGTTSEGSNLSGRVDNKQVQFFDCERGFGVSLIYLSRAEKKGRKLLTIDEPWPQTHGVSPHSMEIVLDEKDNIVLVLSLAMGQRSMKQAMEFESPLQGFLPFMR